MADLLPADHAVTRLAFVHRCIRPLILILLIAALIRPVYRRSGEWLSVVYLLDVSQSASPSGVQSAIDWIEQANNSGRPDHARFVPFAWDAGVFDTIDGLKKSRLDRTGTNIERAIETALHSFAPHY